MLELSFDMMALLLAVGGLAGFVDAIAGGGGLLTMPALLFAGLSPAQAVATNKLQGSFGTFSAVRYFIKRGEVVPRDNVPAIAAVFVGACLGALAIQSLDPSFLAEWMPWALIVVALYVLFSPNLGAYQRAATVSVFSFAASALIIGAYDGFFGPGTGTFFALVYVVLNGYTLSRATAHAKLLNFTSNIVSLAVFILGGEVVWSVGLLMAVGQWTGARLGAGMVLSRGAQLIRPITITMCIAMSVALIFK